MKKKTYLTVAIISLTLSAMAICIAILIGQQPLIQISVPGNAGEWYMKNITDADEYVEILEAQQSIHLHGYTGLRYAYDDGMLILDERNRKQEWVGVAIVITIVAGGFLLFKWKSSAPLGT
ncbi:MAG: hypothetical protein ACKVOR_06100 [Flavobacteriales bacterium]